MFRDSLEKYNQIYEAIQTEKMELSEKLEVDLALEEHVAKLRMELKLRIEESNKALTKLLEDERKMKASKAEVEDQIRKKSAQYIPRES